MLGDLYAVAVWSAPLELGRVLETVRDIAVGDTHLYWADSADSAEAEILRVPIDGSGAPEVIHSGPGLPLRLAVDDFLYFTDHAEGTVARIQLHGSRVDVLDDDVPVAEDIALDEESVFAISFRNTQLIKIARP